jgi:hypothetical protein
MREETQPLIGRGAKLSGAAMVTALVALLAFAPLASAAKDPLAGGTTTIKLNNGLYKELKKHGVKVSGVKPATVKNRTVKLPVAGGELDPLSGQGVVEHSGGVKLKRAKKSTTLKSLVLDTAKKSLSGKLGGKKLKIASLAGMSFKRDGFGVDVSVRKLKLTAKAAKLLNKKLGIKVFKANANAGSSSSATQPSTVTVLPSGKASLVTDKATVKKFENPPIPKGGLGVKIEPLTPAELEFPPFPPILKFPIGGGTIAPNATSGIVQTTGGVKLVQTPEESGIPIPGTTTMTLKAIWVDLGAHTASVEVIVESTISPKLNLGNLARSSIADVNLTGATVKSDPTAHTVTVENAVATLQAVTAETLNSVFGAPYDEAKIPHEKFAPGDGLGIFSFTAQTQ